MKDWYRTPLILAIGLLISASGVTAQEDEERSISDADCTGDYLLCLNEVVVEYGDVDETSWELVENLGYIECAAGWTGCVRRKLFGL